MNCSHIEQYNETVARSVRAPGGWGAEESGTRSEPGPEATVACLAGQLGVCLAEIGLHYETANEAVISQNAAPKNTEPLRAQRARVRDFQLTRAGLPHARGLAAAWFRRDHDAKVTWACGSGSIKQEAPSWISAKSIQARGAGTSIVRTSPLTK